MQEYESGRVQKDSLEHQEDDFNYQINQNNNKSLTAKNED